MSYDDLREAINAERRARTLLAEAERLSRQALVMFAASIIAVIAAAILYAAGH